MSTGKKRNVVVIGGGSGLPVILRPLRDCNVEVTAVVTVADDGGSSGVIRNFMNIVPPGDIRNALVSLSLLPDDFLKIFQYRFESSDEFFKNHALGNLIIAAMTEMSGDIFGAVQKLGRFMMISGKVYPVATDPLVLHAAFTDGTQGSGEHEITVAHKVIEHLSITTENGEQPTPTSEVLLAIDHADMIVFGPGSLYTSILPNLVIPSVGKAVKASPAKKVYIANIMTQKGETDHYTDASHIKAIYHNVTDGIIDYVLTNTAVVPEDYIDFQKWDEISTQVKVDLAEDKKLGVTPINGDFLELRDQGAFHDGQKIAEKLLQILDGKV
ncbi:gluconeogenesis factor YvcK family protein [Oenococcus sp.]|uniref:gluconeogenesis factor YvcK family protein n=1 Tax=Oenococcus sp. TaxID=1979414 RepID=UPI0039EB5303